MVVLLLELVVGGVVYVVVDTVGIVWRMHACMCVCMHAYMCVLHVCVYVVLWRLRVERWSLHVACGMLPVALCMLCVVPCVVCVV